MLHKHIHKDTTLFLYFTSCDGRDTWVVMRTYSQPINDEFGLAKGECLDCSVWSATQNN